LGGGALPGLLRDLYLGRRTGLLHFTHGSDRASVCFINGHIVWGDSTMEECQLGPTMVRHGLLEPEAFERVTDMVGGGKRLGDRLLEFGLLDRKTLDQALALQVREALLAVFSWHEGAYGFDEHPADDFRGYDQALAISTGELILDAAWAVSDADVIRYALGDLDRVLAPTTDPLLRFQRINVTPTDGFILSRVDGQTTARQILATAPVSPEEAQRSLFGLLCVGMIECLEAPKPEQETRPAEATRDEVLEAARGLTSRDHFEVLGLTAQASEADAVAAYHRLVRRFHPDIQHRPELADLRGQITAIFDRLSQAYKVLSDPQRRAEYESSLLVTRFGPMRPAEPQDAPAAPAANPFQDGQKADEALKEAEETLGAGRYWDAIQQVQPIVEGASGRARQRARLLLARCYLKNPQWRQQAEEELKAVLKEEPGSAEAYYLFGTLYRDGGLTPRARAMFRKALELKPRHAGAKAGMAALGPEPEHEGPGLLKKLLG
jgi:curved DNA-binding protein CbpA